MKFSLFFLLNVSLLTAQSDSIFLAEHLALGNPSDAVSLLSHPTNYLMIKKQYVLSYHRFNGIPNWVAWHIDSTWLGERRRSENFRADSSLSERWYRVREQSYRRSGYDRGHLCPSADRTRSPEDNSATFLMTNIIPQASNNNRGAWASLESYCRELVRQGKELYIYCGVYGSRGFIDSGRVNIPGRTWKVIAVLEAGENDVDRIMATTRIIAVDMPNDNAMIPRNDDWKKYRVSVDELEARTGFDFLNILPASLQERLESTADTE